MNEYREKIKFSERAVQKVNKKYAHCHAFQEGACRR